MDKDKAYIFHIIDEISNIEKFVIGMTFESFVSDLKTAKAVERALEIIVEAAKNLSEKFKEGEKETPWRDIAGLRDKIIHHYFDVDYRTVWDIIQKDLPKLNKVLEKYRH